MTNFGNLLKILVVRGNFESFLVVFLSSDIFKTILQIFSVLENSYKM